MNSLKKISGFFANNKEHSVLVVRLGIAAVFLWFGISQLVNPESFLGYLPQWLYPHEPTMMHEHPLQFMHTIPTPSAHTVLTLNGILDTLLGALLLLGLYTRITAFIGFLHLAGIAVSLGYNDIAVRDMGLAIMSLSLAFSGAGSYGVDNRKGASKARTKARKNPPERK